MAKLSVQQVRALAKEIISENPGGIRYTVLVKAIVARSPETPQNTIHGSVWNLDTVCPAEVSKPSRGLYQPAGTAGQASDAVVVGAQEQVTPTGQKVRESDFYEPFA